MYLSHRSLTSLEAAAKFWVQPCNPHNPFLYLFSRPFEMRNLVNGSGSVPFCFSPVFGRCSSLGPVSHYCLSVHFLYDSGADLSDHGAPWPWDSIWEKTLLFEFELSRGFLQRHQETHFSSLMSNSTFYIFIVSFPFLTFMWKIWEKPLHLNLRKI